VLPDLDVDGMPIKGSLRLYPSYKEALEEAGRIQVPNYDWTENDIKSGSVLNIAPPKIKTAYRPAFAALRKSQDFPTFRNFQKSPKSNLGLIRREEVSDFGTLNKRGNMVYMAKVKTRNPVEKSSERIR
jgi:hypothetical protein